MTDFAAMMKDANRLKEACRELGKGLKSLENRMHAAFIMVDRATTADELEVALVDLRKIWSDLNDKDLDYEREPLADTPQSGRTTRPRRGTHTGKDRARLRGDLDSFNVGSSGLSAQDLASGGLGLRSRRRDRKGNDRTPSTGPAGALPDKKRRHRKADLRYRVDPQGPDTDPEVS